MMEKYQTADSGDIISENNVRRSKNYTEESLFLEILQPSRKLGEKRPDSLGLSAIVGKC